MDLESIERALEKCIEREDICHDVNTPSHDDMVTAMALWTDAAESLAMHHGRDLLRLVRAMRWEEAHHVEISYSRGEWTCEGAGGDEFPQTGPTMISAIEAAMQSR